ncbi:MAG TPA: PilZ domain-containing protein [Terriglobales bacterium]|nr:PilZ domain-containing protein [Terriglobales bacterium]
MPAPTTEKADVTAKRSGYRVHCVFPCRVSGQTESGEVFSVPAHTEVITRDGGLIVCPLSLPQGSLITLHNGERQAKARVVGVVRTAAEGSAYGVHFVDTPASSFWDIHISNAAAEPAVGRSVLECSGCRNSRVVELGEIDIMVMERISVIGLFCEVCRAETLWEPPKKLADELLVTGSAAYTMPTRAQMLRERTHEDRKHRRIVLRRAKACIKVVGKADDEVDVVDFSRGGLRFMSTVDYQPGMRVDVAVPYTQGGANIFVPATIIRVILRARAGVAGDYACRYETAS